MAYITEKNILAYVLCYLGLEDASYESEYVPGAGYTCRVRVKVPDVLNVGRGSFVSIPSITCPSIHQAEEEAAYSALIFCEDEMNVNIVDLNHANQLKAKEGYHRMATLLHNFQALGQKVREAWKHFTILMKETHDFFRSKNKTIHQANLSDDWINKLDECTNTLKCMHDKSVDDYDTFCRRLKELIMY